MAFSVHKEEVEISTKVKTNKYNSFTATELKNLIQAAQRYEQNAIDRLCDAFKPLILKEAYKSYVVAKLGDDAENTAWEIFLEFIHAYQGNKYRLLPGLIQMNLHYSLLHRAYPEMQISVSDTLLSQPTDSRTQADCSNNSFEDEICNHAHMQFLLNELTEKQRDIVLSTIIEGLTLDEYRKEHNISFKVAYERQKTALNKLKKYLLNKEAF